MDLRFGGNSVFHNTCYILYSAVVLQSGLKEYSSTFKIFYALYCHESVLDQLFRIYFRFDSPPHNAFLRAPHFQHSVIGSSQLDLQTSPTINQSFNELFPQQFLSYCVKRNFLNCSRFASVNLFKVQKKTPLISKIIQSLLPCKQSILKYSNLTYLSIPAIGEMQTLFQ